MLLLCFIIIIMNGEKCTKKNDKLYKFSSILIVGLHDSSESATTVAAAAA